MKKFICSIRQQKEPTVVQEYGTPAHQFPHSSLKPDSTFFSSANLLVAAKFLNASEVGTGTIEYLTHRDFADNVIDFAS